jgi:Dolichyl-phosphate-mannose-protein mannosyltransferase
LRTELSEVRDQSVLSPKIEPTNSIPLQGRSELRHVLICMGIVSAAILLAWPLGDIAYGDDVAYSHMALLLSRTGHLVYNGWEAAMNLQHAYWGALVIKLLGFSPACMRLSTIPFALGAVAVCYLLVRRAGLDKTTATLVTLVLGLSPIFLPIAVSYMTDVPALFFLLGALYALVRAVEGSAQWKSYLWLCLGVTIALLGGTSRQLVWFVPLVVLPYWAWVRRQHRRFAVSCVAAWAVAVCCVVGVSIWFNGQLYVVPMPSLFGELVMAMKRPAWEAQISSRLLLMLLLMCLPAALPLLFRSCTDTWTGPPGRKILVAALLLAVIGAVLIHPSLASIPWVSSVLNWQGIDGGAPLLGRPIVLTKPIRAVVALTVYAAVCILAGELTKLPEAAKRSWRAFVSPNESELPLIAISLVSVTYFGVMIVRCAEFAVFDRYLLPLIPCTATAFLLGFERQNSDASRLRRQSLPFSWALLCIIGAYAILSTQDYWSLARARVIAAKKLEAAGVSRTAIDAGMEYNFWTQLMINGQLNWRWVKNPPGAYRPGFGVTPDVVPRYRLEYAPVPGSTDATEYGSVPYSSWLPPFNKKVSIDRILPVNGKISSGPD